MSFKVRVEIDPDCNEEIIIKCRSLTDEVLSIETKLNSERTSPDEIELTLGENDYFVKIKDILFFETDGNKTAAHTKDKMFYSSLKLYELTELLPRYFLRVSKSCIVNINAISSTRREITGICEAFFVDTPKKVYISRSYYKPFREAIKEMRLKK